SRWTNGASIYQTGLIPLGSRSLFFSEKAIAGPWNTVVQVAFNSQVLYQYVIGSGPGYSIYGVDVSMYAGQSGELRFTAPWLSTGMLDDIQFSSASIPEPRSICFLGLAAGILLRVRLSRALRTRKRIIGCIVGVLLCTVIAFFVGAAFRG